MTTTTATQQKTLFVGEARICQQIAYVLDIQDYAFAEKLTKQNLDQYRDYQIYVCDFKRKSRGLVAREMRRTAATKLRYLDDICRTIDEVYETNRKCHAHDLGEKKTTKAVTAQSATTPSPQKMVAVEHVVPNTPKPKTFWHGLKLGIKHPLRAVRYVLLRIQRLVARTGSSIAKQSKQCNECQEVIWSFFQRMKPSELLLYVLRAAPNPKIHCTLLENNTQIDENGDVKGCCSAVLPFGNLLLDGELAEIYHSTYARIVKLSSLNGSYCLCNLNTWCKGYCSNNKPLPTKKWETCVLPETMTLSFDRSCNLCCQSCRAEPYVMDKTAQQRASVISAKILRSGWLDQTQLLCLAGMGEVFYSPHYRQLLTTDLHRQGINILSNGTLFNESNWQLVAGKYATVDVSISVDAATAETYQKLRGASFDTLMHNLTMLGDLRRRKQIRCLGLNFVVQRENFHEMPAFVRLGKSLGVDYIQFQRMNNFKQLGAHEFSNQCLIVDNRYLDYELWCVLQDPIFNDPIVDLVGFNRYITASESRYRQRYESEHK